MCFYYFVDVALIIIVVVVGT